MRWCEYDNYGTGNNGTYSGFYGSGTYSGFYGSGTYSGSYRRLSGGNCGQAMEADCGACKGCSDLQYISGEVACESEEVFITFPSMQGGSPVMYEPSNSE